MQRHGIEPRYLRPKQRAIDPAAGIDLGQKRSVGLHLPAIGIGDGNRVRGRRAVGLVVYDQDFFARHQQSIDRAAHDFIIDQTGKRHLDQSVGREDGRESRVVEHPGDAFDQPCRLGFGEVGVAEDLSREFCPRRRFGAWQILKQAVEQRAAAEAPLGRRTVAQRAAHRGGQGTRTRRRQRPVRRRLRRGRRRTPGRQRRGSGRRLAGPAVGAGSRRGAEGENRTFRSVG